MEIYKTLQPGDMGTKRFLKTYGDKLVCVRYRTDKQQHKRYVTIELIIEEKPDVERKAIVIVWVKINYGETELRKRVVEYGAKWIPKEKVWRLTYDNAKKLGLKNRIVKKKVVTNA